MKSVICILIGSMVCFAVNDREPIIGLPCEGCEAIFDGLPEDRSSVPTTARLAPPNQPGERMIIEGTIKDKAGQAAAGIILYAYQTDAEGEYPRDEARRESPGYRHGLLRGWVRSDEQGRFRFETIRPGAYPDGSEPQHVHMFILEPGRCVYYISDLVLADDPILNDEMRREAEEDTRGGLGLVKPSRDQDGTWRVRRDIILGKGIEDYPQ